MVTRKFRFTNRALDALPACAPESASKADEYSDSEMIGLKALVSRIREIVLYHRYTFNGKKRAYRIGVYPGISISEARQKVQENRAILDRGSDPQEGSDRTKGMPTFAEHAQEFMNFVKQYKRSANADESKLRLYLLPYFGTRRLCDITLREIQTYHAKVTNTLAPSTANRHLALLSKMFSLAMQWDRITKNPCLGIKKFKEDNQQQRFLSPEEIGRLYQAMDADVNKIATNALKLLLLTGCRREEVLQAKWEDISLESGTWFLPKGKTGSRYIQVNGGAKALLESIVRTESPYVFPGRDDPNKPLNNPRKCFNRVLKVAGIEMIRIHDLRHSHASLLVNQGVSLFMVQKILGHSSPKTTQRYSHLSDSTLRAASETVSNLVNQAVRSAATEADKKKAGDQVNQTA